ncbi:hypothetical protein L0244_31415, partial [bacterium]|nr:hypothetical protein [bacterium]
NTNQKGNEILREMENATHDKWSHEFIKDKEDPKSKENAKIAEKEIRDFVNDVILDLVESREADSLHIPGLERLIYLPGENEIGTPSGGGILLTGEYSNEETGAETGDDERMSPKQPDLVVIQPPIITNRKEGTSGPGVDFPRTSDRSGVVVIKRKKKNEGGSGNQHGRIIENISCRTFASKRADGTEEHMVIIRGGPISAPCSLVIQAGTDDAYAPIEIVKVTDESGANPKVSGEKINGLSFDQSGVIKLRVTFASSERYALNVTAYQP